MASPQTSCVSFRVRVTFVVYANIDWFFKGAVSSAFIEEGLMARITHVLYIIDSPLRR